MIRNQFGFTVPRPPKTIASLEWLAASTRKFLSWNRGTKANRYSPATGNTFDAFLALAEKASASTIGPVAPVGGTLEANGTVIGLLKGTVVFDADTFATGSNSSETNATISSVPPPDAPWNSNTSPEAGGSPPSSYNWSTSSSTEAIELLQFLLFLDNLFLDFLVEGTLNITEGGWFELYPPTIVNSINTMTVQTYVHRYASSDSLKHYSKPFPAQCRYTYPIETIHDWLSTAIIIVGIETASIIDIITRVASTDPWMIPVLSSALGSKARMSGLLNMMQSNSPAPSVRESTMAPELAYSYLMNHYVQGDSCSDALSYKVLPVMTMAVQGTDSNGRANKVTVNTSVQGTLYVAWWGAWGTLEYTQINNGVASVPTDLYGYVWACVTSSTSATTMDTLATSAMTSPYQIWVGGPQTSKASVFKF